MGKPRNIHHHHYDDDLKSKNPIKVKKNPIKVTYIASPTMVKVSNADEFRAIVQELTGRNSDTREQHSNDVHTTTIPKEDANQVHDFHFQVDSSAKVDDRIMLDTFPVDMSSLEFDEDFTWRGVQEDLFGFQSSSISV
ncbi:VQ motif-containing protein [Corchorus olitorius]|uniref:VQ motif-containing protein n=1 Tax=Corchorus olitorius TaxID=93759 RepID=A0A1R3JNE3_9ROSI|nr:VQ motif-containing protein [Corchorus olitorius]